MAAASSDLEDLTLAQIRELWGVYLDVPPRFPYKLLLLDPAHCCVRLQSTRKTDRLLGWLRGSTECLFIDGFAARKFELLERFDDLKVLSLRGLAGEHDFLFWRPEEFLPGVTEDLDTAFLSEFEELRFLDLTGSQIQQATFLKDLPRLVSFNANATFLVELPVRRMPRLRQLYLISTYITDAQVAAFARQNPQTHIVRRLAKILREAVAATTRIRIRTGSTCHPNPDRDLEVFEITDPEKIREVILNLDFREQRSHRSCLCCGRPSFEFYDKERLLTSFGLLPTHSIRWSGWDADMWLTDRSLAYLKELISPYIVGSYLHRIRLLKRKRGWSLDHKLDPIRFVKGRFEERDRWPRIRRFFGGEESDLLILEVTDNSQAEDSCGGECTRDYRVVQIHHTRNEHHLSRSFARGCKLLDAHRHGGGLHMLFEDHRGGRLMATYEAGGVKTRQTADSKSPHASAHRNPRH